MESTPGKRIQQWREFKKLTATDLHRLTGINVTTISQAENPKGKVSNPSYDTLTKMLAAFPDLNPDWLLLGTGPMLRDGRELTPRIAATSSTEKTAEPKHGLVSGPATVAEAENILLRERIADKDVIIELLKAELGKPFGSSDAADLLPSPTTPRRPVGFGAAIQAALLATYEPRVAKAQPVAELS